MAAAKDTHKRCLADMTTSYPSAVAAAQGCCPVTVTPFRQAIILSSSPASHIESSRPCPAMQINREDILLQEVAELCFLPIGALADRPEDHPIEGCKKGSALPLSGFDLVLSKGLICTLTAVRANVDDRSLADLEVAVRQQVVNAVELTCEERERRKSWIIIVIKTGEETRRRKAVSPPRIQIRAQRIGLDYQQRGSSGDGQGPSLKLAERSHF